MPPPADPPREAETPCPECGHPAHGARTHCLYCGAVLPALRARTPTADWLGTLTLCCPGCANRRLDVKQHAGLAWATCPGCGGQFLDDVTFACALYGAVQDALAAGARSSQRVARSHPHMDAPYPECPVCAQPMRCTNYGHCSGVLVRQCSAHGVWLRRGDLENIRGFVRSGGLELARKIEREASARARRHHREMLELERMIRDHVHPIGIL